MAETGEIGIKGFWKRVTGQAAREEAAREARALELQKAQEAEMRRAEARKKIIQLVTRVNRTQLPDLGIDEVQNAVKAIESQVTARSIYGKFPPEVRIKEQVFHHDPRHDFSEYGDMEPMTTKRVHSSLLLTFGYLLHETGHLPPDFSQGLAKKHFLMVVNVPNTEDAILSYQFLQKWRDSFGRSAFAVAMNFRLRREPAYKLLDLVRIEPEAAEMFLQTAAEGFEANEPNSPTVGIPRVKSDEVVIVNFDRFKSDLDPYFNYQIAQEMLQNKNGQIEIYKYSAPHGVADPDTIPTRKISVTQYKL